MPENIQKNAKKAHFSAKVTLWYFQKYVRYGSNVFWGSKHIPWSHSEAISRPPTHSTAKTPSPLVNNCLFWRFWSYFYLQLGLDQELVNTWSLLFQKGTQRRNFDFFTKYFFQLSIQKILPCCGYLICSPDQARQNYGSGFLRKCLKQIFLISEVAS